MIQFFLFEYHWKLFLLFIIIIIMLTIFLLNVLVIIYIKNYFIKELFY